MRLINSLLPSLLFLGSSLVSAASWSFEDASVSIQAKGTVDRAKKESFSPSKPLAKAVTLRQGEALKVILTVTNGGKGRKPHQAFLTITDPASGLEESYPFTVKDSGKAKVDLTHSIIPSVLLKTSSPLKASIVIGSFGSSTPYKGTPFDLAIALDANTPQPSAEPQLRYGKQPEIHHVFCADPKSPPKIITLAFAAALVACIPALFIGWGLLGANLNHLSKALGAAPISHILFFGSIVSMEGVFFLYYTSWTLFQTLPVAGVVGLVAFLSGSRALSEVQERRLAGQR
ncbi:hypothetical protein BLS_005982 [Venturia inaequalis]|uniref:Ribophorin II C-terminal domain-containing protein n=1 Tax=Venturia inaequalis TaxID=5025 RepID=A0A8H3UGA1_VENIN|nr:hypothetical protein BLS_005982 [Venturia inaequalis]